MSSKSSVLFIMYNNENVEGNNLVVRMYKSKSKSELECKESKYH